jgi:hypothetical protein
MTQSIKTILFTLAASAALSTSAFADGSVLSSVSGRASFERHVKLTPMICIEDNCPSRGPAEVYWSLVVISNGARYEFSQPIALGSSNRSAPANIQLAGVELHPGEEISVQGLIETYSDDYGVISQIDSISVLNNESSLGLFAR